MTPQLIHDSPTSQVWWGDALDVASTIPKESIDLIVTDPPYGKEWQSGFRADTFARLKGDGANDRDEIAAVLRECVRIVGQNRHLYVFGPSDVLEGLKVSEAVSLIWDKGVMGAGDLAAAWGPAHEPITFATSKYRHAGQAGKSVLPVRLRKGTVLRFGRPTGRKVRHPSEKPTPLLRELIESSSRQGDTVLDPFAGIGSTAVAAIASGRKAIIVELDKEYANMAVERVRRAEVLASALAAI